jgi:hypothetical protein
MMKQLFVLLGLACLSGCAKQDNSIQTNTVDSLQRIIANLNAQVLDLNAFIAQQSTKASSTSNEQAITKEETSSEEKHSEWKKVRNGGSLNVTWKMKIAVIPHNNEFARCWLSDGENGYDMKSEVDVYRWDADFHDGDILIVTGKASGVSDAGTVQLHATKVINKGIE